VHHGGVSYTGDIDRAPRALPGRTGNPPRPDTGFCERCDCDQCTTRYAAAENEPSVFGVPREPGLEDAVRAAGARQINVYVAGASSEIERAERFIAQLKAMGARITYDWTAEIRRRAAAGLADHHLTPEEAAYIAWLNIRAVQAADFAVVLVPHPPASTSGAWAELAAGALSDRTCVIAVASPALAQRYMFVHLAEQIVPTDDRALELIALESIQNTGRR
jgi:hypothetical protein